MAANDMESAKSTYESFLGLLKWAVPLIALIAFVVVILIAD